MHTLLSRRPGRAGCSRRPWWPALLVVLGVLGCPPTPLEETPPKAPSLYLELVSQKGSPVARALVHHSEEPLQQRSNERGAVQLQKLPVGPQLLQVQAKGYSYSLLSFHMAEGIQAGARLTLLPLEGPYSFDSSKEYSVDVGSLSITIPPGALSDSQGQPVEEVVDLFVGRPDLENDELVEAPNLLEGVVRPGAEPVGLETLGMVALVFQRKDGQILSFAKGPKIRDDSTRGNFGLPGGRPESFKQGAPLTGSLPPLPVWRVDPERGYWVPTGDMGTLEKSGSEPGRYKWEVTLKSAPHLFAVALPFWWRSPAASREEPLRSPEPAWVETSCLDVRVKDAAGQPVAGRLVTARGVDYVSMTRALTDADGRARLEVMRGKKVKMEAGGEPRVVDAGSEPGNCKQQGAEPVLIPLEVPARTCTPGAERECAYGGPKGTLGVGACRAGRQVCDANGTGWSETCEGEVHPQPESCDSVQDDNCDGTPNEGCETICREGDTLPCYEGPEGTAGVGPCHAGTRTCMAGGTAWSACEGQLLPEAEDCSLPGDEDCDGVACRCWPQESQRCGYSGPEGTEGVGACRASTRACNALGTDWSACTSEVLPQPEEDCTTPGDDDCDGEANEGTVCVCVPHSSQGCYSGPEGTQDVGVCHAGTQQCNASGTGWGACSGEVTPQVESCANATDDDCNGHINDATGCVCLPGANGSCYTGPTGTQEVGLCHAGTRTCAASGTKWEACTGEVTPLPEELCTTPGDDDCDGTANEGTVCICAPSASESCYGGPTGTQGVGVCRAGTRTCNASGTAWGACTGDVTPVAELCFNTQDDDCDGKVDENPPCAWSRASPMADARVRHTATRLKDGKVLVSGGTSTGNIVLQKAELYNPDSNTWSSVRSMGSSRDRHTATLLDDGKVLIAGGYNSSGPAQPAELYDPVSNTWSEAGNLIARHSHTATLLNDGKVLIAGGLSIFSQLYDPVSNTWSSVRSMVSTRDKATATLLGNGKVLVSGGADSTTFHKTAELYDPVSNTWTATGSMSFARDTHTATLLDNGKVLVSGGRSGDSAYLQTAELYDPAFNTWSEARSMAWPRYRHTATRLNDGRVLITGGHSGSTPILKAELYDPVSDTWSEAGTMASRHEEHTATLLENGKVLVAGTYGASEVDRAAELYDPATNTWTTLSPSLTSPLASPLSR